MNDRKQEVLGIFERYWNGRSDVVSQLPVVRADFLPDELPPQLDWCELPEWASECGVDGKILLPKVWALKWDQVPWYEVAWWMANGWAERLWEKKNGCIDSYSFRLSEWDARLWNFAWVNRIALFLRCWAARENKISEENLFGSLPKAELLLTHDVDAVSKTGMIRIKQGAFNFFNSARLLFSGKPRMALEKFLSASRFLFSPDDYMGIPRLMEIEKNFGLRSTFHFYSGKTGWEKSIPSMLIDPGYDISSKHLSGFLRDLLSGGWEVGLHPSALTWQQSIEITGQRTKLEAIISSPVTKVRQHWLRFSWEKTWSAQEAAGLKLDSTLGFNDRPGFRNSAALRMKVCSNVKPEPDLESVPMFLMDSHLYDYSNLSSQDRKDTMRRWLRELKHVGGVGSIIWHTQVLGKDYGWGEGYETLLKCWSEINIE